MLQKDFLVAFDNGRESFDFLNQKAKHLSELSVNDWLRLKEELIKPNPDVFVRVGKEQWVGYDLVYWRPEWAAELLKYADIVLSICEQSKQKSSAVDQLFDEFIENTIHNRNNNILHPSKSLDFLMENAKKEHDEKVSEQSGGRSGIGWEER